MAAYYKEFTKIPEFGAKTAISPLLNPPWYLLGKPNIGVFNRGEAEFLCFNMNFVSGVFPSSAVSIQHE